MSAAVRFSNRLPDDLSPNRFAVALAERRASGASILDLTVSNPTAVGLPTPLVVVAGESDNLYAPYALGTPAARQAVSAYYAQRGIAAAPDRIFLTASTSEAYVHLFRLLADAEDNFLVPQPSYPLFEPLAHLEAVRLKPYPLRLSAEGRWRPDLAALRRAVDDRTRGVLVVHPNNPTGSLWPSDHWADLSSICAERRLAVLADEVFGDFVYEETALPTLAGDGDALTFVLGGLSKSCGTPHAKLAWTLVGGPEDRVAAVMQRLEWIGDAFLSVSAAAQAALPRLLGERHTYLAATRARVLANRDALAESLGGREWRTLPIEGGWTGMIRLPPGADEERTAMRLLEAGVLVQPGYFFDVPEGGFLAVSLIVAPTVFAAGARVIASFAA